MNNTLLRKLIASNEKMLNELSEMESENWMEFILDKTVGFQILEADKDITEELGIEGFLGSHIVDLKSVMADEVAIGNLKANRDSHNRFCWNVADNYSYTFLYENSIWQEFEEIPFLQYIIASKMKRLLFRASGEISIAKPKN